MNTKPGLTLRKLGSRFMIVDGGESQSAPTAVHTLNATAADVWKFCESHPGFTAEDVAAHLISGYIVDPATALSDARDILSHWIADGLVTE